MGRRRLPQVAKKSTGGQTGISADPKDRANALKPGWRETPAYKRAAAAARRAAEKRPSEQHLRLIQKIRNAQKETKFLVPRATFIRVTREITKTIRSRAVRWTKDARLALQVSSLPSSSL